MNKRLKVTLKILDNVASKYPETTTKKKYIETLVEKA